MQSRVQEPSRPHNRGLVAITVILLVASFGPALCTLRYPAPLGRTVWGVTHRLDRDLPRGTSQDSAVAYLNRTGVHYLVSEGPPQLEGWEEGIATQWPWPLKGDLVFGIFIDQEHRVVRDTVYKEIIFP